MKQEMDAYQTRFYRQRLGMLMALIGVLFMVAVSNHLSQDVPLPFAAAIWTGYLVILLMGWIIQRKQWYQAGAYVMTLSVSLLVLNATIYTEMPVFPFLGLILATMFQNGKVLAVSAGAVLVAFNAYYAQYINFQGSQQVLFNVLFLLSSGILVYILITSETLSRNFMAKQQALEESERRSADLLRQTEEDRKTLERFTRKINDSLSRSKNVSTEIKTGFLSITEGVGGQTDNLSSISHSLKDIAQVIDKVSRDSKHILASSTSTNQMAAQYMLEMNAMGDEMEKLSAAIHSTHNMIARLNERNQKIEGIVNSLNELSEQTHLLAMNASIEAEKAAEQGKGFKVVASEVKKLAVDSRASAKEIKVILREMTDHAVDVTKQIDDGLRFIDNSKKALDKAERLFVNVSRNTKTFTELSHEQKQTTEELRKSSNDILQDVEAIATISAEIAMSSEQILLGLENQDSHLNEILESFKEIH